MLKDNFPIPQCHSLSSQANQGEADNGVPSPRVQLHTRLTKIQKKQLYKVGGEANQGKADKGVRGSSSIHA